MVGGKLQDQKHRPSSGKDPRRPGPVPAGNTAPRGHLPYSGQALSPIKEVLTGVSALQGGSLAVLPFLWDKKGRQTRFSSTMPGLLAAAFDDLSCLHSCSIQLGGHRDLVFPD